MIENLAQIKGLVPGIYPMTSELFAFLHLLLDLREVHCNQYVCSKRIITVKINGVYNIYARNTRKTLDEKGYTY